MKRVAVVAAKGLGDGLIALVLSQNLVRSGHKVTTFNPLLPQLQRWFPHHALAKYPKEEEYFAVFSRFDEVIAIDYAIVNDSHSFGNTLHVLKEGSFNWKKTFVENLCDISRDRFHLPFHESKTGLTAPKNAQFRKYPKRVVIHAMSTDEMRTWPKKKFIQVARKLRTRGFEVAIVVSPEERSEWLDLENDPEIALPLFPTLDETAFYIYESGYLIGNNSGLGHLASNMGVPTLSLFARKSYANLWRPGWGRNTLVTPLPFFIGARLKQKYWKQALPVTRVLNAFEKVVREAES